MLHYYAEYFAVDIFVWKKQPILGKSFKLINFSTSEIS